MGPYIYLLFYNYYIMEMCGHVVPFEILETLFLHLEDNRRKLAVSRTCPMFYILCQRTKISSEIIVPPNYKLVLVEDDPYPEVFSHLDSLRIFLESQAVNYNYFLRLYCNSKK